MLLGSPPPLTHHKQNSDQSLLWEGKKARRETQPGRMCSSTTPTSGTDDNPPMGTKAGMKGHRKGALYMRNDWTGFMRASANTERSLATEKMPGERQPPLQSTAYMTLGKSCKLLDKHPWTKRNQVCVMQLMIKGKRKVLNCSVVFDSLQPPWTVAHQAPPSMEFSRQEYWSGFAIPFARGSSQLMDRTQISCTASRFFTVWATREVDDKAPCKC